MGLFNLFTADKSSKLTSQTQIPEESVKVTNIKSREISESRLSELSFGVSGAALVIAYVSPNTNFEQIMSSLKAAMPFAQKVIGVMTAGELSSCSSSNYHTTEDGWDNIVLQSFDPSLFAHVDIRTVDMHSKALTEKSRSEHIELIR